MKTLTRRTFLSAAPASAVSLRSASALASAEPVETPEAQLERAVEALFAAMTRIHGEGCWIQRNGNSIIAVMEPVRPRIVEFQGPGKYEVEIGKTKPIMAITRAPDHDSPRFGRCFYAVPQPADLKRRYYFEDELRKILIRKI